MGKFIVKLTIEDVKKIVEQTSECTLLDTEYFGTKHKMNFLCRCGNQFTTTFEKFKLRNKKQCNKCGRATTREKQSHSINNLKQKTKEISDCVLLTDNYINVRQLLEFRCGCGDTFKASWNYFNGNGKRRCDKCSRELLSESKSKYSYEYVKDLLRHNNAILITQKIKPFITIKEKIKAMCACKKSFTTTLEMIHTYDKFTCNYCSFLNPSTGEMKVKKFLDDNQIIYEEQYSFKGCKYKKKLRFDFAVFDNNKKLKFLIEFDGIQHFKAISKFGGEKGYNVRVIRDKIKNKYCLEHGINLIRISYLEEKKIEKILFDKLIK